MKILNNPIETLKSVIKNATNKLTGAKRREYMAKMTNEFLEGNARKAEREFGWSRVTVNKGLQELKNRIKCIDNYKARGKKKTEIKLKTLEEDIRSLVDPKSQAEPRFRTTFAYTRITAKAVRQALIDEKGYTDTQLPTENTIGNILNRLGYRLKPVQKTKPIKKIPQVDEIFDNINKAVDESDTHEKSLRISIDVKTTLAIGEFSRGGKSRCDKPIKAYDHDFEPNEKLVPFGIFEPGDNSLTIIFGTSVETSDFIMDCLEKWWLVTSKHHDGIEELVITLDNGPHLQSYRTQFIKRMTEFADKTGLAIRLIYYPPSHSKYNPVERCFGILEQHWNGTILNSVTKAIEWAKTMTFNGIPPIIHLIEKVYQHGVTLTKTEMEPYEARIQRAKSLPKWDVSIMPIRDK